MVQRSGNEFKDSGDEVLAKGWWKRKKYSEYKAVTKKKIRNKDKKECLGEWWLHSRHVVSKYYKDT